MNDNIRLGEVIQEISDYLRNKQQVPDYLIEEYNQLSAKA